ncbi:MAG: dipeptidase [Steroidobacteraceae bacterium]|jgi:acetylornithine deacetylase/succinyl-diaminopimelate desuccinylase-like protein
MSALRALDYARAHRDEFLSQLKEFIRIPTVSTQPQHNEDLKRCAHWLAQHLRRVGLDRVSIVATERHPLVYAEWLHAPGQPTLLIYGHYDVQPVDPVAEWRSPPFTPTVRGDDLYARGACDDKGQLFTHVKALESYLATAGRLPINVKCLFEGEEEIGSTHLFSFVARSKRLLAADAAVLSDTRMLGPDRPAISYAERGAVYLELCVRGPQHDLHSGSFGGAVHNPLQVLCEIIAKLHDANRHIAIPGFYDRVRRYGERERASMARAGPSDEEILADARTALPWGERCYSLYERTTLRPALTINGMTGGYQGPGGKGIIPARATAKLSFRLVPDQDPGEVDLLFRQHIARVTPATARTSIRTVSRAAPAVVDPRHPAMRAASLAYRKGFGAKPVFLRSGGTIPILAAFQRSLAVPTVLMGFALPDDRMHAPNEKFHIPNFYKGIDTSIWFMDALAKARPAEGFSTRDAGLFAADSGGGGIHFRGA